MTNQIEKMNFLIATINGIKNDIPYENVESLDEEYMDASFDENIEDYLNGKIKEFGFLDTVELNKKPLKVDEFYFSPKGSDLRITELF